MRSMENNLNTDSLQITIMHVVFHDGVEQKQQWYKQQQNEHVQFETSITSFFLVSKSLRKIIYS